MTAALGGLETAAAAALGELEAALEFLVGGLDRERDLDGEPMEPKSLTPEARSSHSLAVFGRMIMDQI